MSEVKHTPEQVQGHIDDAHLIALLRREGQYSDVWFSEHILRAANRLELRNEQLNQAVNSHGDLVEALRQIAGFSEVNGMTRMRMRKIAKEALSKVLELGEGL